MRRSVRIAGDTAVPALQAMRAKGYTVSLSYEQDADGELRAEYTAERGGRLFSGSNPEETLGLVAMWEVRGDDWHANRAEIDWYESLLEAVAVHDGER